MRLHRTTSSAYAVIIVKSGDVTYIAKSKPGTLSTSATWQAMKIDKTSGAPIITWADGNDAFDNAENDLASLNYA